MTSKVTAFGDRLAIAVRRAGNPVCVGLDPRWEQLPKALTKSIDSGDCPRRVTAYVRFCEGVIDVVSGLVPVVKPQVAFFEQLGPAGMQALADVVAYARDSGLLVIIDAKRNDIGSTAEAYADAFLGAQSVWGGDALTVSPYLGDDSLTPFVDIAMQRSAGLFVLAKTSNPGGGQFQDLTCNERPLFIHVAEHIERITASHPGSCGYGPIGAVVGATYPQQMAQLRSTMPHAWFLVPGFGSQGATARDVAPAFDSIGLGAIVNNSRGIIFAQRRKEYADKFDDDHWQEAIEAATREMIAQLRVETPAGNIASI
jgi:orotidine-5'-phosphate decarboxylase